MATTSQLFLGTPVSMEDDPTTGARVPLIKLVGDSGASIIDSEVGGIIVVDSVHHEVHEGITFQTSYASGSVANSGNLDLIVSTTGTVLTSHASWVISSGGDAQIYFYEGITGTYGTQVTGINLNRQSSNTPEVQTFTNPSVSVLGLLLHQEHLPGGFGPSAPGGVARRSTEWMLATNKRYLLRATNIAGTAQPMSINFQWYED